VVRMINALLAAILGSAGSGGAVQHSKLPVVTYGADALAQAAGGTSTNTKAKATKPWDKDSKALKATNSTLKATNSAVKGGSAIKGAGALKGLKAGKVDKSNSALKSQTSSSAIK